MKLTNVPDFTLINDTLNAYYENNEDYLYKKLYSKYRLTSSDVAIYPLRILKGFINSKSSLYSNTFDRIIEGKNLDKYMSFSKLNNSLKDFERYFHLFHKAAIYIYYDNEKELWLTTALDPTIYHIENNYAFLSINDEYVLIYELNRDKTVRNTYISILPFETVLNNFDNSLADYGCKIQLMEEDIMSKPPICPIIELTYPRIKKAYPSSLCNLELNYILQMTWGLWNTDPKLVDQKILKTDMEAELVKTQVTPLIGRTTKVLKLNPSDTLEVYDAGDISVLKDLSLVYDSLISQRALQEGVSVRFVLPTTSDNTSGVSKQYDFDILETKRADFILPFTEFDQELFNSIAVLSGLNIKWVSIEFKALDLFSDKISDLDYVIKMVDYGFMTYEQGYAYLYGLRIEQAESIIKDNDYSYKKVNSNIIIEEPIEEKILLEEDNGTSEEENI